MHYYIIQGSIIGRKCKIGGPPMDPAWYRHGIGRYHQRTIVSAWYRHGIGRYLRRTIVSAIVSASADTVSVKYRYRPILVFYGIGRTLITVYRIAVIFVVVVVDRDVSDIKRPTNAGHLEPDEVN